MLRDFNFAHYFEIDEGMSCAKCNEISRVAEKSIAIFCMPG